jgi:hypothetical protein
MRTRGRVVKVRAPMLLQINEQTRIEDPRQYGSEVVGDLRNLLTAGRWAQRDPHRENFYEIENV